MRKTWWFILLLGLVALLAAGCGTPRRPEVGTLGQISLVFFFTEA